MFQDAQSKPWALQNRAHRLKIEEKGEKQGLQFNATLSRPNRKALFPTVIDAEVVETMSFACRGTIFWGFTQGTGVQAKGDVVAYQWLSQKYSLGSLI